MTWGIDCSGAARPAAAGVAAASGEAPLAAGATPAVEGDGTRAASVAPGAESTVADSAGSAASVTAAAAEELGASGEAGVPAPAAAAAEAASGVSLGDGSDWLAGSPGRAADPGMVSVGVGARWSAAAARAGIGALRAPARSAAADGTQLLGRSHFWGSISRSVSAVSGVTPVVLRVASRREKTRSANCSDRPLNWLCGPAMRLASRETSRSMDSSIGDANGVTASAVFALDVSGMERLPPAVRNIGHVNYRAMLAHVSPPSEMSAPGHRLAASPADPRHQPPPRSCARPSAALPVRRSAW